MKPRSSSVARLSHASATLTFAPKKKNGTETWYEKVVSPFAPMSLERSVPTSQPRRVAAAFRERRFCAIRTLSSASTAPVPSFASTALLRSAHHVLPVTFLLSLASRIARQPSGHDFSVPFVSWTSAAAPAAAGAAMLVPLFVSWTQVTIVPFAAISGSSRSLCDELGFLKTESLASAPAESSWLATVSLLKPLWLTNSELDPFPAASQIVGYGQWSASQSLYMSSKDRPELVCSGPRWKLWLITVHPRVRAAQLIAARSLLLAEWRLQSFAWPCGLLASMFLMIPCVCRAWSSVVGFVRNLAVIDRRPVSLSGPSS